MERQQETGRDSVESAERDEIIKLYAARICQAAEYHRRVTSEIESMSAAHELSPDDERDARELESESLHHTLARLLIEQYFNTGDEDIFDRALRFDESVHLERVSYVNTAALYGERAPGILLFHEGFFFNLQPPGPRRGDVKVIVRDRAAVEQVNRKLERARWMLAIDEATLGLREYEGLCRRTHFRYWQ